MFSSDVLFFIFVESITTINLLIFEKKKKEKKLCTENFVGIETKLVDKTLQIISVSHPIGNRKFPLFVLFCNFALHPIAMQIN